MANCRDFNTLEDHNNRIVDSINSVVMPEDTLYCLGDFAFSGVQTYFDWRPKLNCQDIHLIAGNHEKPADSTFNGRSLSSLFESYTTYKEFRVAKKLLVLFHYPIASWNEMAAGSIHLHGHTHSPPASKFFNGGRSMDVGLDGNNYMPYSLDEIMSIMNNRPTKKEGHHV